MKKYEKINIFRDKKLMQEFKEQMREERKQMREANKEGAKHERTTNTYSAK